MNPTHTKDHLTLECIMHVIKEMTLIIQKVFKVIQSWCTVCTQIELHHILTVDESRRCDV